RLHRTGRPAGGLTLDAAHQADGRGWISAKLVGTTLGMPAFRSAPRRDAPEIAKMAGNNWRPDSVNVSAVQGCSGKYIEVTATPVGGKPVRGWSWSPCAAQLTRSEAR